MAHRLQEFWRRLSGDIAPRQLWTQFHADARASYQLYSKEVRWTRQEGESGWKRLWRFVREMFWAMAMKLSPARRVLFLLAILFLFFPGIHVRWGDFELQGADFNFLAGVLFFVLLALELADRVAMKRDLEIAREIQGWLMPSSPPEIPWGDIAFTTRPANTVAGDYYDAFFRSPGTGSASGHLLLVVADVAGKSVPAALLMATLQASLRTIASLPGSLSDVVANLNGYVCAQSFGGRRFTTAFFAELDPATGECVYINAGHNWPILRRASGTIERLEAGGLPLGIRAGLSYECGHTVLASGDLLVIFTDGLVEAENATADEFGETRLLQTISSATGTSGEILRRLMASVDAYVGFTRQHDDITCLVLRAVAVQQET